jgi:transmembrane sensor
MTNKDLQILLRKYLLGTTTDEEREVVDKWYISTDEQPVLIDENESDISEKILDRLNKDIDAQQTIKRIPWKTIATIAASIIIVVTTATWYYFSNKSIGTTIAKTIIISPGSNRATLIKSDGTTITLGDDAEASIQESNGMVINNNGSQLIYTATSDKTVLYNTLQVPLKGVYSVILADGTKVWLNSLSSLYYPTAFTGKDRKVKVTGEAFFEVAQKKSQPFIVEVEGKQEIEVLGTSFNVNAYTNENFISTTLITGAIKINTAERSKLLKPGEQVQLAGNQMTINNKINTADIISWKDGFFSADGKDVKAILRQAMRWYDIEVEYKGDIKSEPFVGQLPRNINLSELLNILEITGVHFTLQGKKLTVLP